MDVATYLQCFENSLTSYTGDDPLDPWDKFVVYLEQRLPADSSSGMSLVFDSLVQRFLTVERYANDVRFVNYCIKCASYYSDPIALYSHIFSKGVGTRTAALYVAWAQQFEQRGLREQAEAVYQKAAENQAQPVDTVLHEHRQFQTRTRSQTAASEAGARNPLQNSHLTNQMSSHREPQNKASAECQPKPPVNEMAIIVSRSETSATVPSNKGSGVQTVSEYMTDELVCEGSELCFEEVRAEKYFRKLRQKQEREQREITERMLREQEEGTQSMTCLLKTISQVLGASGDFEIQASSLRPPAVGTAGSLNPDPTQHPSGRPRPSHRPSSRVSLGLRLHSEPAFIRPQEVAAVPEPPPQQSSTQSSEVSHHASVLADVHLPKPEATAAPQDREFVVQASMVQSPDHIPADVLSQDSGDQPSGSDSRRPQQHNATHLDVSQPPEPEEKLDVSQGGTASLSHITPNTSLGFVQATPSRVLPSPTVNTREALGVIMDMFQAPTFLEETFGNMSVLHGAETQSEAQCSRNGGVLSTARPPTTAPFAIFQDDSDKENGRAAAAAAAAAAPCGTDKSKPIRALAEITATKTEKPNDTPPDLMPDESTMWGARYNSLNSLAACPNSTTDFAMLAHFVSTPFTHKTPASGNFYQEQENNCDGGDGDDDAFIRRQQKKLSPIMEQSPCEDSAVSQLLPPSARQGTIVGEGHCLTTSSITMVQPPPPAVLSFRDQTLCPTDPSRTFTATTATGPSWEVYASPEHPPKPLISARPRNESFKIMEDPDKPASPERVQKPVCDVPMSPDCAVRPDWLVVRSPEAAVELDLDAFLSPCRPKKMDTTSASILDIPMSPEQPQICRVDEPMVSPERRPSANVSMNAAAAAVQLVSDPWDDKLISHLLSSLTPPLTSHPRCITWQCNIPAITPKTTISMGKASLRVDCVLGKGAFATVYQATDPMTSERMVLKVQKPANPWEFYINTRLDARLQPDVRQLYGSVRSAHLFHDGSVLLGELHNYGTLLNAVNIYRSLSDKVMPQPLVIYFTVCILHMVEQLHAANIIHADIKPDNFMLGERFLENRCFDPESSDHGLVLLDLGQSIDMELFPQGAAFTAKCLTSGFQCTEMLSGRPWNYQTDYFGIAGTVYCMLFGTYMQVTQEDGVWKTNGVFRR